MNEEIKELLEHIEILDNTDYILHSDKAKALLDYITNLQEENERLEELNVCVGCENSPDYKLRCEKAVKYIKKNTHEYKIFNKELGHFSNLTNISIDKNNKVFIDNLLNILNGGDEEMNEEQIREMCNDIYEGGDWEPMIDYIINLQGENDRLYWIINELEKWLYDEIERTKKLQNPKNGIKPYGVEFNLYQRIICDYTDVFNKLNALKIESLRKEKELRNGVRESN